MSEIVHSEIIYEEGWRKAETPAALDESDAEQAVPITQTKEDKEDAPRPIMTILQLALCMIAALALFFLKAMDSGAFSGFMEYYDEEMSKPVVSQKVFDTMDWNALFGGDNVSVTATPDEISPR